jgi:uncharacterized protein YlxW (UPF0749 family)
VRFTDALRSAAWRPRASTPDSASDADRAPESVSDAEPAVDTAGSRGAGHSPWRWLVPAICLIAGLLFATSHEAAKGGDLRAAETTNLADLVRNAENEVSSDQRTLRHLQDAVDAATAQAATGNTAVEAAEAAAKPLRAFGGLIIVAGPGLEVVLDDAPNPPAEPSVDPNQLVVHQSDLQAVVNALWAGGAEAMTIAGQRVVATSAVRCVGNTLLLNGRVFSPPFRVVAIGPAGTMSSALDRSPGVSLFKQAASYYGLGYTVSTEQNVTLPAYDGSILLRYAKAAG